MGRTRRILRMAGLAMAGLLVAAAGITGYAAYNLTWLITHNQGRILQRLGRAVGRPVKVAAIKAKFGLGLAIELDGLAIADDPAFSRDPFFVSAQTALDVRFIPLLRGKIKVHRLELTQPVVRILRRADGMLNLDTLGELAASGSSPNRPGNAANAMGGVAWAIARDVSIKALAIDDGTLFYRDAAVGGVPLQITHLSAELDGFHTGSPFDVDFKAALFSEQPNFRIVGKMGPMLRQGVLDVSGCPLELKFRAGPVSVDSLRTLLAPGQLIPVSISMPAPVSAAGAVTGTLANFQISAESELSNYRIVYRTTSNTPATAPLVLNLSGKAALRGGLRQLNSKAVWDLTATFSQFASRFEGAQLPAITDFNGQLHLTPARLELQPANFTLGSSKASLQASADSLSPLRAAFTFKADSLQLSQIVPSRPPGEFVNGLSISGTAHGETSAPIVNARITSGRGLVERLAYNNLDVNAAYAGNQISAQPLSLNAFGGSVLANVNALATARAPFDASASVKHINVTELFRWLDVHTDAVSGFLTADAHLSGAGTTWKEIAPGLHSNGRMFLSGGKLRGINIVAIALNRIAAAPVVSQLVSVAFRSSHQGLFADSNTDLSQASMTFNLNGTRVTTNDLLVQSPEYQITGAGWFDFDKNIDMSGDIKLTLGLSAAIPVVVMGKYPALLVLPNIPKLAERTAVGVVTAPINIIKGGASAVGSVLGGFKSILP
jgi:uncharacterized protein involved in outer membrane biogenesis